MRSPHRWHVSRLARREGRGRSNYEDVEGFCKSVKLDETAARLCADARPYVGAEATEDDGEPFEDKMKRLTATFREQQARDREARCRERCQPEGSRVWLVSDHRTTVGDYVTLVRGTTYKGSLVGESGPALLGAWLDCSREVGFRIGQLQVHTVATARAS